MGVLKEEVGEGVLLGDISRRLDLLEQSNANIIRMLAEIRTERGNRSARLYSECQCNTQVSILQEVCDARLRVIEEQQAALSAFGLKRKGRSLMSWWNHHAKPKLGRLQHHQPFPLHTWALPPKLARNDATCRPRISIVTPSFGQAPFIARTIESVLSQDYPQLEYFIQDGGSSDGTVEILERYSERLAGWASVPDSGQSHAINLGFARTSGEIMAWLNSDDLLLPGTLAYVGDYFAHNPGVDVVYGHRILIDEQDMEIGRWILPPHSDDVLSWADFIPQETLFWRRAIWDKAGGRVDESFRFAMDWDLLLRFRDAGARMVRLPFFLGAFRIHDAQKTSAAINSIGIGEMDRLRERHLGRRVSRDEIRRALVPYMLSHLAHDVILRVRRRMGFS